MAIPPILKDHIYVTIFIPGFIVLKVFECFLSNPQPNLNTWYLWIFEPLSA